MTVVANIDNGDAAVYRPREILQAFARDARDARVARELMP